MLRPYTSLVSAMHLRASNKNRTFVQVPTKARIANMTAQRYAHQIYDGAHRYDIGRPSGN
jgi:hypothetical protein